MSIKLERFLDEKLILQMNNGEGIKYWIHPLTKKIAEEFGGELAKIESLVPNTLPWTKKEVVAEILEGKELKSKWKLSQIVFNQKALIGVAFAYEREAEPPRYKKRVIYLHRGAILKRFRGKKIGLGMVAAHIENALVFIKENPLYQNRRFPIKFQTNDCKENYPRIKLYEGLGAIRIGRKKYSNKTDWVFGLNEKGFINSELYPIYSQFKTR